MAERAHEHVTLDLAAECGLVSRDILCAATGLSYDAAARSLLRLCSSEHPYLLPVTPRAVRSRPRTGRQFTLRPAGVARLATLGSRYGERELRAIARRVAHLRWELAHGPASTLAKAERVAMLSALLPRSWYTGATHEAGDLSFRGIVPGADLGLGVDGAELDASLTNRDLPWVPPLREGTRLPVEPDIHVRATLTTPSTARDGALLVFIQDGTGESSRAGLLAAVARACALAPVLEASAKVGPYEYPTDAVVRVVVWLSSLEDEGAFGVAARAALGDTASRL